VNKTLLLLLTATFFALAALPGVGRAAPADGDYIALHVPDLAKAVDFFNRTMDCDLISKSAASDATQVALLDCGHGAVVELSLGTDPQGQPVRSGGKPGKEAVALVTDDPAAAAAWLRTRQVTVIGQPVTVAHGADAGRTVVRILTPWGQPLQLVSPRVDDPLHETAGNTRLAAE
jgi:catechol 2,3-dioxygenase-like lactoylglutathione lyase family enzyme